MCILTPSRMTTKFENNGRQMCHSTASVLFLLLGLDFHNASPLPSRTYLSAFFQFYIISRFVSARSFHNLPPHFVATSLLRSWSVPVQLILILCVRIVLSKRYFSCSLKIISPLECSCFMCYGLNVLFSLLLFKTRVWVVR